MKNFITKLLACALLVLTLSQQVRADDPVPTVFDGLNPVVTDAGTFFGTISALAIIVTGFFLGRRWLRRVG